MRSPMLMEGYRNLPGKTAEVMRDGWYRSGDIMRRDADGFYSFLGRADDMFVVGGEHVRPGKVERLLETMPGVHQACRHPARRDQQTGPPAAHRDGGSNRGAPLRRLIMRAVQLQAHGGLRMF